MFRKISLLASSSLLGVIIDLLGTMIVSRAIFPEGVGQVALVVSLGMMYVAVANMGLGQAYIYLLNSKGYLEKEVIHACIIAASLSSGVAVVAVVYVLSAFSGYFGELSDSCRVLVAVGVASSLSQSFFRPILVAKFKVKSIAVLTVGLSFISVACYVVFYCYDVALLTVDSVLSIQSCARIVVGVVMLWVVGHGHFGKVRFSVGVFKHSFFEGGKFYFSFLISQANMHVALLLMQKYMSDFSQVGLYSRAASLTLLMTVVPFSIGPLLYSRWAKESRSVAAKEASLTVKLFSAGLLVVCPVVVYFSESILAVIYGGSFALAANIFSVLVVGVCLKIVSDPLINFLSSIGKVHFNGYASVIGLVVVVLASVLLVPRYEAIGAAFAFVLSNLSILLILLMASFFNGVKVVDMFVVRRHEINKLIGLVGK